MAKIIDKDEKRCDIALASIALFCEKGIQQTSIDQIAKSAGVAKGTIYLYFKNKEEIVFTIWDIITQQHEESFKKRTTENMSTKEKILEYFNFNEFQEKFDKEQILILFQHFVSSMLIDKTQLYTAYFESFFQKDYDFISSCLKEGIKKGEFFIDDIDILTNNIIMLLKGLLVKAKASNMNFDETQNVLSKHIIYLLEQCTKEKQ
ncbi:TetR family transcriptional regulator [Arcobacter suis]|uniref:Transcriptional regulator, TetR/AcrR family n=1 Tax=Arcobacter suis CECT 7833 TaxID=663365 RepID=A0AAD0STQ1_9BACT|nr:TetR/AcrR family transcriptional regulator [Arcobacter suis]AXX90648.1 transcriptional regulator, TetR/AcrR family [Arcobacter suis CECT 7833]RWS46238.1 TetR family transcriptional regulator [Arcobacter suis]